MNKLTKLIIAASAAVIAWPLTAAAQTTSFSAKGAYGSVSGNNGNLYLSAYASEQTTRNKSDKATMAGVSVSGNYYTGTECWYASGSSDAITFNVVKGPVVPRQVTASATVPVTWYEYCSNFATLEDTVTVYMNLTAITDQAYSSSGSSHTQYGPYKEIYRYDYSDAPASLDSSFMTSQQFGTVYPSYGSVGQSKTHNVSITKQ
ncbi:MAG: hypothetical protein V4660_04165 [Pseudomonadota bacterium]